MSEVKWIKLTTDIFSDEKIRLIDALPEKDAIFVIWIKLLVLAGKTNDAGTIYLNEEMPYTDEMLSTIFDRPVSIIRLALETFKRFGMIRIFDDQKIEVVNWDKHQNVEGLERIREQSRKRVAAFRKREKDKTRLDIEENVTVTLPAPKPVHHRHGDKVLLTEAGYKALCDKHGKANIDNYISKVNDYCVMHGTSYKDYKRGIETFIRRDKERGGFHTQEVKDRGWKCKQCNRIHYNTMSFCPDCKAVKGE